MCTWYSFSICSATTLANIALSTEQKSDFLLSHTRKLDIISDICKSNTTSFKPTAK